jgi:ABC-type glycerol-3-phosphate transport system substrate-binding protein
MQAIASAIQSGTDLAVELQGVVTASLSTQPLSTAGVVTVNTPQPTSPPEIQTIHFSGNYGIGDVTKLDTALDYPAAEYQKAHPEVRITWEVGFDAPKDGYTFRALAQKYDCFVYTSSTSWEPLPVDDLLDLTPFVDASPTLMDDFQPAFLAPFQKDGKLYGLPADVNAEFIGYNEDLLTQLGLSFPDSGWTFEDMMALAAQAANPTAATPIYGLAAGNGDLTDAIGLRWYDDTVQPPHALFNTNEAANALAWLDQLYLKGTFLPTYGSQMPGAPRPANYTEYIPAIANGQVAMWLTDGLTNYNQDLWGASRHPIYDKDLPFKIGYVALPFLASGDRMSYPANSVGYYISSHAKNPEACWNWIQFLSSRPVIFGGYSPRKSVLEQEPVVKNPDQFAAVKDALSQYGSQVYAYPDLLDMRMEPYMELWFAAETAVLQGEDAATVLADAQRKADTYLDCIAQKDITGLDGLQVFNLAQECYAAN